MPILTNHDIVAVGAGGSPSFLFLGHGLTNEIPRNKNLLTKRWWMDKMRSPHADIYFNRSHS